MTKQRRTWYILAVNGDGTHNKKLLHIRSHTAARGMTPIEKNIIVVDEQGNEYEATFPKRAKGLVKKGRARFVDDKTICLACPPNKKVEDKIVSENINNDFNQELAQSDSELNQGLAQTKYSLDYVLTMIEGIAKDTEYLHKAMDELKDLDKSGAKPMAIGNIVESRENTNQRLIDFYQKVYEDLKPERATAKRALMEELIATTSMGAMSVDLLSELLHVIESVNF